MGILLANIESSTEVSIMLSGIIGVTGLVVVKL